MIIPYVWENSRQYFPAIEIVRPDKQYHQHRYYEGKYAFIYEDAMQIAIDMAQIEANRINAVVQVNNDGNE